MPESVVWKSLYDVRAEAARCGPFTFANRFVRVPDWPRKASPAAPPPPESPCTSPKPSIRPSPLRSTGAVNAAAFGVAEPANAAKLASLAFAAADTVPS